MKIEEYMKATGISVKGLAALSRVSIATIYKYLAGERKITGHVAMKLAAATKNKISTKDYGYDSLGVKLNLKQKEADAKKISNREKLTLALTAIGQV